MRLPNVSELRLSVIRPLMSLNDEHERKPRMAMQGSKVLTLRGGRSPVEKPNHSNDGTPVDVSNQLSEAKA